MTSGPSLFAQAYTLADILLANNVVPLTVAGTPFVVGFNDSYNREGRSEIFDAHNVIMSILNLQNSTTMLEKLSIWNDNTNHLPIYVDIKNEIDGTVSQALNEIAPILSINVADSIRFEYMGEDSAWFDFTIQGVLNHVYSEGNRLTVPLWG